MAGEYIYTTQMCESTSGKFFVYRLIAHGIMQPFSTIELLLKSGGYWAHTNMGHFWSWHSTTSYPSHGEDIAIAPPFTLNLRHFLFPFCRSLLWRSCQHLTSQYPSGVGRGQVLFSWVRVLLHNNPMIWQSVWRQVALSLLKDDIISNKFDWKTL